MNIQSYKLKRQNFLETQPRYRTLCLKCLQPQFGCYCEFVESFDSQIKFVILIHPIEAKRRIATGRMSHLCLRNSELIMGQDYSANKHVDQILSDEKNQCYILYPGRQSLNLSDSTQNNKPFALFKKDKIPTIFVIDGTWATARKTMRLSENLKNVPRICFTPPGPSRFRVRKQPSEHFYSTIEAIHYSIELLGTQVGFDLDSRNHDKLLVVFDKMVERQLACIQMSFDDPSTSNYRRPRFRVRPGAL